MDKKQLLEWIQSLPDDAVALPLDVTEIREECGEWEMQHGMRGLALPAVYKRQVKTEMALRINFTGTVTAEFQRDESGNPRWHNIRHVK